MQRLSRGLFWLTLLQASALAGGVTVTSGTGNAAPPGCEPPGCFPTLSAEDRDALGRLAYAEAGNQGEEGLAAVLYAVLNRLGSGKFGSDVKAVIEAPGQFEPVDRAGGHWRNLPPLSAIQITTIETILDLMQQGRLPDLTHGATFFQNPQLVAAREAAGQVRAGLTNFGNQQPIAVVRDHAFFGQLGSAGSPATDNSPHAHLVYPPGVVPTFRVERVGTGTPANPHGVMYRITSVPNAGAVDAGFGAVAAARTGVRQSRADAAQSGGYPRLGALASAVWAARCRLRLGDKHGEEVAALAASLLHHAGRRFPRLGVHRSRLRLQVLAAARIRA